MQQRCQNEEMTRDFWKNVLEPYVIPSNTSNYPPPISAPVSYEKESTDNDYFFVPNAESEVENIYLELVINLGQHHPHLSHLHLQQMRIKREIKLVVFD